MPLNIIKNLLMINKNFAKKTRWFTNYNDKQSRNKHCGRGGSTHHLHHLQLKGGELGSTNV